MRFIQRLWRQPHPDPNLAAEDLVMAASPLSPLADDLATRRLDEIDLADIREFTDQIVARVARLERRRELIRSEIQ